MMGLHLQRPRQLTKSDSHEGRLSYAAAVLRRWPTTGAETVVRTTVGKVVKTVRTGKQVSTRGTSMH
jgi:hypothetical protein